MKAFFSVVGLAILLIPVSCERLPSGVAAYPPAYVFPAEDYNLEDAVFELSNINQDVIDLPDNSSGMVYCRLVKNVQSALLSNDFWSPESISEKDRNAIELEYYQSIVEKLETFNNDRRLWIPAFSTTFECIGDISITSTQPLFGKNPGENLADSFLVGHFGMFQLSGPAFEPFETESYISAQDFFGSEKWLSPEFVLVTEEPFDSPVTLTIDIPVNKVMYLSYLRDKMRDGEAELSLVPWTFHGTVTMNNIK